jgi:hypothetical protein
MLTPMPHPPPAVPFLLVAAGSLALWVAYASLRGGTATNRGSAYSRNKSPMALWALTLLYAAFGIGLVIAGLAYLV